MAKRRCIDLESQRGIGGTVNDKKKVLHRCKSMIVKYWRQSIFVALLCAVFIVAIVIKHVFVPDSDSTLTQQIRLEISETASPETSEAPAASAVPTEAPEEGVYTFLQGPRSWKSRLTWSGKWGRTIYDGSSFGAFGCGFCCMANIYCTHSKYKASPIDFYQYSKKHTEYGGGGAIAWEYMQSTLERVGFQAELKVKPDSYQIFQNQIAGSDSAIVLVSSYNSDCYWKDTPGHYVTVFLYDAKRDKIFLADSGDPEHNRHWVSLKKIYRSLKTESDYQFMTVGQYAEDSDKWKHKEAEGTWVKPN
ncbi:MAG: hypothetical protein J1E62_06110 [Lachnospiraceae bacterium]|nr:hypothetical protein [Lachnospiraceae bacterium]